MAVGARSLDRALRGSLYDGALDTGHAGTMVLEASVRLQGSYKLQGRDDSHLRPSHAGHLYGSTRKILLQFARSPALHDFIICEGVKQGT